jgi:hypothetical protein
MVTTRRALKQLYWWGGGQTRQWLVIYLRYNFWRDILYHRKTHTSHDAGASGLNMETSSECVRAPWRSYDYYSSHIKNVHNQ